MIPAVVALRETKEADFAKLKLKWQEAEKSSNDLRQKLQDYFDADRLVTRSGALFASPSAITSTYRYRSDGESESESERKSESDDMDDDPVDAPDSPLAGDPPLAPPLLFTPNRNDKTEEKHYRNQQTTEEPSSNPSRRSKFVAKSKKRSRLLLKRKQTRSILKKPKCELDNQSQFRQDQKLRGQWAVQTWDALVMDAIQWENTYDTDGFVVSLGRKHLSLYVLAESLAQGFELTTSVALASRLFLVEEITISEIGIVGLRATKLTSSRNAANTQRRNGCSALSTCKS